MDIVKVLMDSDMLTMGVNSKILQDENIHNNHYFRLLPTFSAAQLLGLSGSEPFKPLLYAPHKKLCQLAFLW